MKSSALFLATAALLALAGCSRTPTSPLQAECERKSYDDPLVKQLMVARVTNAELNFELKSRYDAAQHQALERCLIGQGGTPPGGVEPVQPGY